MVGAGDDQRDGASCAARFGQLDGSGDFLLLALDHDLTGAIEVGDVHIGFETDID
jgi:hypothetical protein